MQFVTPHRRARSALTARCFGIFTLTLLSGYALFGRGFAYLGIPPYAYCGELGLLLGILTLCTIVHLGLWRLSLTWLLVAFMAWGFCCTIPNLSTYGMDSLRDAVVWAYGIYALAVATVVLRFNAFATIVKLYGRALPVFLIIAPLLFLFSHFAGDLVPKWPWGPAEGVSIIELKAGDLATQYAGAFPFLVSGLLKASLGTKSIALWVMGTVPLAAFSRGALVTIASAVMFVMLLRPALKTYFTLAVGAVCMLLVFVALSAGNIGSPIDSSRSLSLNQIFQNIESIFSSDVAPDSGLEATKQWRQKWWEKIAYDTFDGEYFWTGKGFGINLADADGFQTDMLTHSLRSPHNIHMTILARSGVPGLLLWVTVQVGFALKMLMNFLADRRAHRSELAAIELWILLYWLAFIINGSFDVFLEGPQGGIWFWCVFGFGLAVIADHRRLALTLSRARSGDYRPSEAP